MINVSGGYTNPQNFLTEVDREFIERINNRITVYGQIPYTVPSRLIIEMIKECALTMYRQSYSPAQQEIWYKIDQKDIVSFLVDNCACGQPECISYGSCKCPKQHTSHHVHAGESNSVISVAHKNLKGYGVKLPPFVNGIRLIVEANVNENFNGELEENNERSGSFTQSVMSMNSGGMYQGMQGINQHLYTYERTVKMTQQNVTEAIYGTKHAIPHDFNRLTKTLFINKSMGNSVMIQAICNVPVQYLYEDDLFIKYVYARCKKELKRVLGGHTFELPGGVQLNADEICSGADEEIQSVEEILKNYNSVGDIIMF